MPLAKPIFSTSSYRVHSSGEHEKLADMGFDFVTTFGGTSREWQKEIDACHKAGLKVVFRWPNWKSVGCLTDEFAFSSADNHINFQDDSRLQGASYWHPEADEKALASLEEVVAMGVDGLLLSPLVCDRPTPTDWWPIPGHEHYATWFWSHDRHAKKAWAEVSDGFPMPAKGIEILAGREEHLFFYYQFYQKAWINRITKFAKAATNLGIKYLFTWWTPLVSFGEEEVANATAESTLGLEQWRQTCIAGGATPIIVAACVYGLWPRWRGQAIEALRQTSETLDWINLVGAEIMAPSETAFFNLKHNGELASNGKLSGLFCGDKELLAYSDRTKKTIAELSANW